MDEGLFGMIRS
jgi:hypothetical protein